VSNALLIARLLLAIVFVVAGITKLTDRTGLRQAIIDFGVPATLATSLGLILPLAELAVAGALIPRASAWWGAIGALSLLLLFIAGILANLARGRKPDCHCFGQLHSSPVGWKTLWRNGVLVAVAGFVAWRGWEDAGPSTVHWLGDLSTAQLVGLIVGSFALGLVVAQWWFLLHLLRQNGRLLVRLEALEGRSVSGGGDAALATSQNGDAPGLPLGNRAPTFSLPDLYGETLTLDALRAAGKPVLLLFTDPNCGPCNALLPDIGRWQQEHAEKLTISLISRGTAEANRTKSSEHGLANVVLQEEREVSHSYEAYGTPSVVLIRPNGRIGSPVVSGADAIRTFMAHMIDVSAQLPVQQANQGEPCPKCGKVHVTAPDARQAMPTGPKVGEPAPPVQLQNLDGETIELKDFRGEKTLVLFWNPGCGFCQQMLDDLKTMETNPSEAVPKILIISAGTIEANKAMDLSSPVVLDQEFAVGRAFGASGTPSAVLVDEQGKIASGVAVGASEVLKLAGAVGVETG
jgi:peroxiredoxin